MNRKLIAESEFLSVFKELTGDKKIFSFSFHPLERVYINIQATRFIKKTRIVVTDGNGTKYVERKLVEGKKNNTVTFLGGGALGRHSVLLYVDDKTKPIDSIYFNLEAETKIITNNSNFDTFYKQIKSFMLNDTRAYFINGKTVYGYRSPDTDNLWLRDHTHQMKGFKYWETDMKSLIEHFLEHQGKNGSYYEYVTRQEGRITYGEGDLSVEADREYLIVKAVYTIWQATGEDEWMFSTLPSLEKGLDYTLSDPKRWSKKYSLVKRPFTIDTWDFEYHPPEVSSSKARSRIDKNRKFCIMHGDNSGVYKSCRLLSQMYNIKNEGQKSKYWRKKADEIKTKTNEICWNGKFYTHQFHIDPVLVKGVNEENQLSLSNPYDINRGLATHQQAVSIIREYQSRRKSVNSFAEWFSINPPFPANAFGLEYLKPGIYVNGGIMPLVGGELAKAAFDHGFAEYGLDILQRYQELISSTGETYLWYQPNGTPASSGNLPTDGWGSAEMLYAFIEGLVGIEDKDKLYNKVKVSPRWSITKVRNIRVVTKYGCSLGYFAYNYKMNLDKKQITIQFTGSGQSYQFHLLLPRKMQAQKVSLDSITTPFKNSVIENDPYVDFNSEISGITTALVNFTKSYH